MKKMTCNQLGGACDMEFRANTFEEMSELSKKHGMEMFQKGDKPHLDKMMEMRAFANSPGAMEKWYEEKRQLFNSLPDIS